MPSNADSARFWSKVAHGPPDQCWDWTAQINGDGYGVFSVGRRPVRAHRYAWESVRGLIPTGKQLDHLCRNRRCVNPHHLEVVTNRENVLRGESTAARDHERGGLTVECPNCDRSVYVSQAVLDSYNTGFADGSALRSALDSGKLDVETLRQAVVNVVDADFPLVPWRAVAAEYARLNGGSDAKRTEAE